MAGNSCCCSCWCSSWRSEWCCYPSHLCLQNSCQQKKASISPGNKKGISTRRNFYRQGWGWHVGTRTDLHCLLICCPDSGASFVLNSPIPCLCVKISAEMRSAFKWFWIPICCLPADSTAVCTAKVGRIKEQFGSSALWLNYLLAL